MGEVYLAEDTRLGRQVALKVLPAEVTKDESRLRRKDEPVWDTIRSDPRFADLVRRMGLTA